MKLKKIFYINRCFITTDLLTYKKHYNTGAGGGVRSCGLGNESKKKKSKNLLHIIMHSSPHLFMNVFLFLILLGINWHIQLMPPFKYHMFNTVLEKFPFSSLSFVSFMFQCFLNI